MADPERRQLPKNVLTTRRSERVPNVCGADAGDGGGLPSDAAGCPPPHYGAVVRALSAKSSVFEAHGLPQRSGRGDEDVAERHPGTLARACAPHGAHLRVRPRELDGEGGALRARRAPRRNRARFPIDRLLTGTRNSGRPGGVCSLRCAAPLLPFCSPFSRWPRAPAPSRPPTPARTSPGRRRSTGPTSAGSSTRVAPRPTTSTPWPARSRRPR